MTPSAGDILHVGPDASPAFAYSPLTIWVIKPVPVLIPAGWAWLEGWQLDRDGRAVRRRAVFVRLGGLVRGPHRRNARPRQYRVSRPLPSAATPDGRTNP